MATVEELRDGILWKERVPVACDYQSPEGEVHERTWRQVTREDLDSLIAAVREDERNRIEAEGFLLRDANSVLQIGKCSVIPTAELNAIAEYCSVPEPKGADNDQG